MWHNNETSPGSWPHQSSQHTHSTKKKRRKIEWLHDSHLTIRGAITSDARRHQILRYYQRMNRQIQQSVRDSLFGKQLKIKYVWWEGIANEKLFSFRFALLGLHYHCGGLSLHHGSYFRWKNVSRLQWEDVNRNWQCNTMIHLFSKKKKENLYFHLHGRYSL